MILRAFSTSFGQPRRNSAKTEAAASYIGPRFLLAWSVVTIPAVTAPYVELPTGRLKAYESVCCRAGIGAYRTLSRSTVPPDGFAEAFVPTEKRRWMFDGSGGQVANEGPGGGIRSSI